MIEKLIVPFLQLLRGYIVYFRRLQSTVPKKMATGTFLAHETPKIAQKTHRKGLKASNLGYAILLVQG